MYRLLRTTYDNDDFLALVRLLDAYLSTRNGDDDAYYAQFNTIDMLQHVMVLYDHDKPLGCGAFKPFDAQSVEIKRMYTLPDQRGKGIATQILTGLEEWAREISYSRAVLETGAEFDDAIALYQRKGYVRIANYGQYAEMSASACFEKML